MKELSIKEKAKRYDKALDRAKEINNEQHAQPFDVMLKVFPELKESRDEGEEIRKWIIDDIRYNMNNEPLNNSEYKKKAEKAITWLKKQGQKPTNSHFTPEQADILDKHIDEFIKQNPADKVEPKFKVGDWIVSKTSNLVYRVDSILFPQSKCYYLSSHNGSIVLVKFADEQNYRLWTIQDAKDGDVLATKDAVFIFKHIDKTGLSLCKSYCEVIGNSELGLGFDFSINGVNPATKEQRDLLFSKMKEAGYEWDAEKKKPVKDEIMIKAGRNYRCTKTHIYAGLDWLEGTKYYADEDYSLVNNGCTCFCPKYSKYEHNNLFEEVECDGCIEKQGKQKVPVNDFKAKDWYVSKVDGKIRNIYHSVDKVEPKFNVGDKIQYSKGCGTIMTIEKIENGEYIFGNNMGHTTIESGNKWYLVEQKSVFEMKTPEESLGISSEEYNKIVDECIYAFINKAAIWFNNNFMVHDEYGVISDLFNTKEEMFDDFKNYMKGE